VTELGLTVIVPLPSVAANVLEGTNVIKTEKAIAKTKVLRVLLKEKTCLTREYAPDHVMLDIISSGYLLS
jgi:hypothetical protein